MTIEQDTAQKSHPKDSPYWKTLNYDWIIPHIHAESTSEELIALLKERYGDDMTWYDAHILPFLIRLATTTQDLYSRPWMREHFPLPEPSEIEVEIGSDAYGTPLHQRMDLTPWMEEMASYTPEQREVRMYTNGEYKRNPGNLLTTMVMAVDRSALFGESYSFNSLFHCVRDDTSPTLQKYRRIKDEDLKSSIAVVLPNRSVKIIQRRGNETLSWNRIHQELWLRGSENTCSLEDLAQTEALNIQHVINCSDAGSGTPYTLTPTAHSGFQVNIKTGQIYGSYDHALADGTVVQSYFMQMMYDIENHHQSEIAGVRQLLPLEDIHLQAQQREQFTVLTGPKERKQAIAMLGMPDLSYPDLMMVLMQTRANQPDNKGMRSITGTATSNYPRPITGDKRLDHYAAMENRIGIFQEQFSRHKEYLQCLNRIRSRLVDIYGKNKWMHVARTFPSDVLLGKIPLDELREFAILRKQSQDLVRQEIRDGREDKNMSTKIIQKFHGTGMNWKGTRLAQKLVRKKMLGNINGTLLSQMTLDEGQIRPRGSPDYFFTTITPDRNNAGLTILKRTIISNRPFFQKNMNAFIDDIDRHPQTLSRNSHVLYFEDKDPEQARLGAIRMLANVYENWVLMNALIDVTS